MTSALVVAPPRAVAAPPADVTVQLDPNPFKPSLRRRLRVPHGSTVAELVSEVLSLQRGPLARRWTRGWRVRINGLDLAEHLHGMIVPPPGATVAVRLQPAGLIFGAILAISHWVATAALGATAAIVGTGVIGTAIAATVGSIVFGATFTALVGGLGYALFAASRSLTSPQTQGRLGGLSGAGGGPAGASGGARAKSDSPTISGQGNALTPWAPIWRVFGTHRIRPFIVGKPYTEVDGGNVYLRMLLCCGYGPLSLSDMRLGTTPLEEFGGREIYVKAGWAGQALPDGYPGSAVQEQYQIRLHSNAGGATADDKIRTTALDTTEIGLEIVFPAGFVVYDDMAEEVDRTMIFRVQYRETVPDGQPVNPWEDPNQADDKEKFRVSSKDHGAKATGPGTFEVSTTIKARFYIGVRFWPGRSAETVRPGQYDVRVRVTRGVSGAGGPIAAEVYWQSMRSLTANRAVNLDGLCLISVRLKASNQLAGAVENFNCIATSYLRTWDPVTGWTGPVEPVLGEGWSTEHASNPAWAYAEILMGRSQRAQDRLTDAHVDMQRIYEWAQFCDEQGLGLNAVIDFGGTTYQALQDVAATGLGSPHMRDGRVSVVYSQDTRNETPVALLTPRNIVSGSFKGTKSFEPVPHAFRVRFLDANDDYEFGEVIVYRDGYGTTPPDTPATDFAELELWGVTDADLAWKYGRRRLAEMMLRPEFYQVEQDFENMVLERGDLVSLAHDVPLFGLAYGAVTAHSKTTVTLDEEMTFEPAKSYGVILRNPEAPFVLITAAITNPATGSELVKSKVLTYSTPFFADFVKDGAIASVGERGIETRRCIVKEIEPLGDMNARLTLMDEATGVWDAVDGPIPPYDPGISFPVDSAPRIPVIEEVTSVAGAFRLVVRPADGGAIPPRYFEVWLRRSSPFVSEDSDWTRMQLHDVDGVETIEAGPAVEGNYYDLRVRAIGGLLGRASGWASVENVLHAPPVSSFRVTGLALRAAVGTGTDTFVGSAPEFEWRLNSPIIPDDFSLPIAGGAAVFAQVLDYEIRVVDPTTGQVVRTDHTTDRRYVYSIARQDVDGVSLRRFWLGVAPRDVDGVLGAFSWIEAENSPPRLSKVFLTGGVDTINARLVSHDRDVAGYRLWAVTQTAYPDPALAPVDDTTLRVDSRNFLLEWDGATADTDWWVWAAAYDDWGPDVVRLAGPYAVTVT